jgi:uncharacterized protein (DUF1778 family)
MAVTRSSAFQIRLDPRHKRAIERAAKLRGLSASSYLRQVLVPIAEREVEGAARRVIEMAPHEQLELWQALAAPARLTPAQRKLARIIRGEE